MAFFHTSATAVCFSWQPQIILALRLFRFCDCQWYDKRPSLRIARKIGSLRELSTDQMHHSASFLRRNSDTVVGPSIDLQRYWITTHDHGRNSLLPKVHGAILLLCLRRPIWWKSSRPPKKRNHWLAVTPNAMQWQQGKNRKWLNIGWKGREKFQHHKKE